MIALILEHNTKLLMKHSVYSNAVQQWRNIDQS